MSDSYPPPSTGNPPPPPPAAQGQPYQGQTYPGQAYPGQAYQGAPQGPKTSGMAIAALVVGLVSLLLSFIPVINVVAILGALVALVLGILAVRKAKSGLVAGRGLAIAGIVISALALVIAIIVSVATAAFVQSVDDALDDAVVEMEEQQDTDASAGDADEGADATEDQGSGEAAAEEAADDAQPEGDAPSAVGIGSPARDGKFEFTVTEIEDGVEHIGDEFFGEEPQGQFVLVHLTVENIGDEAQYFDGSSQEALDAEGRTHSADGSAAIYLDDSNSFLNQINPGNKVDGVVVFDIPVDAELVRLDLHDSAFSGGVVVDLT